MIIKRKHILITLGSLITVCILFFVACIIFLSITFHQFIPLLPKLPTLLGFGTPKTYLILFQNNMELFPSGGFIGSYATLTIKNAKVTSLTVHNVYDADGQLQQHVEPYYIMRRYSQVHLYMRDSNFDADFVKSAQDVIHMYQLETGHHADGVIAMDVSFAKSIVSLLSPIFLWQYNVTITPSNFFLQTEFHADRYSFYGSTQKQDYLHALLEGIQQRFDTHKLFYAIGFLQKGLEGITQKHILFELQDPNLQEVLTANNLSSALSDKRITTPTTVNDFLGINEANIGANKANYFLKRNLSHTITISNSGVIVETLHINYTNTSKEDAWPTGRYLAYIRLILPLHAKLTQITINGQVQKIVPAITNFHTYEAPNFKAPDGLEVDSNEEEGKTIYGFVIRVAIHSARTLDISYQLETKLNTAKATYNLVYFKQPGTDNDPLNITFTYPKTFTHVNVNTHMMQANNTLRLKTSLLTDKNYVFSFAK